jgi:LSD1 subclass zinc finger protein
MLYSRARSGREELALVLGGDTVRCALCERRFVCFLRFNIPTSNYDGYSNIGDSFRVVWLAIFAGLLTCLGLAFWTLSKFHRLPF